MHQYQKFAILIILLSLLGLLVQTIVDPYRGTWFRLYGMMFFFFSFYGSVVLSIMNTIGIITLYKRRFKNYFIWMFISSIPLFLMIYFVFIHHLINWKTRILKRNQSNATKFQFTLFDIQYIFTPIFYNS